MAVDVGQAQRESHRLTEERPKQPVGDLETQPDVAEFLKSEEHRRRAASRKRSGRRLLLRATPPPGGYNPRLMKNRLVLGAVLVATAACSSGPPRENLPERTTPLERRAKGDEIVALLNGQPVTWQAVAEKVLELNLKESVDQYVRWRIVEDRKAAMAITHTPEELKRRAAAYLDQVKKQLGEERYRQQLAREGATEEAKRAQLEGSQFLAQVFTLDKIVRYAALLEDQIEIDRVYFADEAEARRFREAAGARGFDAAAKEFVPERKAARGRLPRETFPKSQPPADPLLDAWILEELLRLKPGDLTGVEMSRSNLYYVVRLLGIRKGREVVYSQVREEVLEGIYRDPPAQQEYLRWMEKEMARCRVEYSDGGPKREKGRGGP
jgi:hypothetical protein